MTEPLAQLKDPAYLTTAGLLDLYKTYENPHDKIKNLVQQNKLRRVRRDLYVLGKTYKHSYSKEVLANLIYGPSAISFEYALSYHGLIPERVENLTSICFKRNKKFTCDFGVFTYKYISEKLFSLGIEHHESSEGNFHMASKEKALCDMAYFAKLKSNTDAKEYLIENLRIDREELFKLDSKLLFDLAKTYKRESVAHIVDSIIIMKNED